MFVRNYSALTIFSREVLKSHRTISLWQPNLATPNSSKSHKSDVIKTVVDPQSKVAVLTMNRLPANALNNELMKGIKDTIHDLELQNVQGVIITSASNRIFSAGLDLTQAYNHDEEHLTELWRSFQDMWKAVFATKLPTAALINGHALAGGCMLACCCDYRVILPNYTIGLNGTRAGITLSKWIMDSYVNVILSRRVAEADLMEGKCYKSEDALTVGLVDDLVPSREVALQKCMDFIRSYEGPTRLAKAQTKLTFRADILADFEKNREKDLSSFLSGIQRPEVQEYLGNYLNSLRTKKFSNKVQ